MTASRFTLPPSGSTSPSTTSGTRWNAIQLPCSFGQLVLAADRHDWHTTRRNRRYPEKLVELYHGERNSLRDIAAGVGVSRQTVTRLARYYGIELREAHGQATYDIDRDWLYEQYVDKRRSIENIAEECGMSVANMARWAKVHDIPVRRLSRYDPQDLQADERIPSILRPALAGVGGWERLQRFADSANYRTLQIAAQELGLNQFTLVDQVNRIERDLGRSVLVRANSGRPMKLTPFGSQVVAAVRVFIEAQQLEPV